MEKITIAAKKENFSKIKKIIKTLTPGVKVNFIIQGPETAGTLLFFDRKKISCGFFEGADFMASDINITEEGTNFKLNYNGNSVPVWLKNKFEKEEIGIILPAICVAVLSGFNMIGISETLKNLPF